MNFHECILVYNPVSGHGHLDSWAGIFVHLLLKQGFRVLCLTPNPDAVKSVLAMNGSAAEEGLHFLEWTDPAPVDTSTARRFLAVSTGIHYGIHEIARVGIQNPIILGRNPTRRRELSKKLFSCLCPFSDMFLGRLSLFLARYAERLQKRKVREEEGFLCPREMAGRVNNALKNAPYPPQFMLNMYMDMYKIGQSHWEHLDAFLPDWGGIRFCPSMIQDGIGPREGYWQLETLRGVCFLEEKRCREYEAVFPEKHIGFLPDITSSSLPESDNQDVSAIKVRAGNRKVVFMGGSLSVRKGLCHYFDLVRLADPSRWFFVLAGRIYREGLDSRALASLNAIMASPPENLLVHEGYFPDEREFNSVIAASDFIYAVYLDFPHSSNMLGKAAHFKKPILVSNRFLMGERVREYNLGAAVPEGSAEACLAALENLVKDPISEDNFVRYLNDFNTSTLAKALRDFVLGCLNKI